jgi:hypothetical protein
MTNNNARYTIKDILGLTISSESKNQTMIEHDDLKFRVTLLWEIEKVDIFYLQTVQRLTAELELLTVQSKAAIDRSLAHEPENMKHSPLIHRLSLSRALGGSVDADEDSATQSAPSKEEIREIDSGKARFRNTLPRTCPF